MDGDDVEMEYYDVEEDNFEEDDDKDEHVAEDQVDDHDVAEEVEDDEVEDDVKGEKDYHVDVEEEEDDDVEEDAVEEEDRSQDQETHFVRACAVEKHVHMSQETSEEPLYTEIYSQNGAAQIEQRTRMNPLYELAQSKRM